jgi:hypothetical protein
MNFIVRIATSAYACKQLCSVDIQHCTACYRHSKRVSRPRVFEIKLLCTRDAYIYVTCAFYLWFVGNGKASRPGKVSHAYAYVRVLARFYVCECVYFGFRMRILYVRVRVHIHVLVRVHCMHSHTRRSSCMHRYLSLP